MKTVFTYIIFVTLFYFQFSIFHEGKLDSDMRPVLDTLITFQFSADPFFISTITFLLSSSTSSIKACFNHFHGLTFCNQEPSTCWFSQHEQAVTENEAKVSDFFQTPTWRCYASNAEVPTTKGYFTSLRIYCITCKTN